MNLDDLANRIQDNHLEVSQRLTAIETTMTTNQKAYGDIPERVRSLEKAVNYIKGAGAILALMWSAGLTYLDIRFHR